MHAEGDPPIDGPQAHASHDSNGSDVTSSPAIHEKIEERFPDLHHQSFAFLERVETRFGANSRQTATIFNALHDFKAGQSSKRDTYSTIIDELDNDEDLRRDLWAILGHDDASYDPRDFQRDGHVLAAPQNVPAYLQPEHNPLLPLPRMSNFASGWSYPSSINPTLLTDRFGAPDAVPREMPHFAPAHAPEPSYNNQRHNSAYFPAYTNDPQHYSQYNSLPQLGLENMSPRVGQYTLPALHAAPRHEFMSPTGFSNGPEPLHLDHGEGAHFPHSFSLHEAWGKAQYEHSMAQESFRDPFYDSRRTGSVDMSQYGPLPSLESPQKSPLGTSPSVLGTPAVSQPMFEVPSPTGHNNDRFQADALQDAYVSQHGEEMHNHGHLLDKNPAVSPPAAPSIREPLSPHAHQSASEVSGVRNQFVHSLCGKAFSSRHGVKKHHWGSKVGNLETVTGCWAKHGKPSEEWDAHPSCKDTLKANTSKPLIKRTKPTDYEAPEAPSMIPNRGEHMATPTMQDHPHQAAESFHMMTGEYGMYHSHQMPRPETHGNLDALLTVVNAASIDAPKAQGRIDSVVAQLDAQAHVADFQGHQSVPSTAPTHDFNNSWQRRPQLPYRPLAPAGPAMRGGEIFGGPLGLPQDQKHDIEECQLDRDAPKGVKRQVESETPDDEDASADLSTPGHMVVRQHATLPGTRKTRHRNGSAISEMELKSLGLAPPPDAKRQRTKANGVDGGSA